MGEETRQGGLPGVGGLGAWPCRICRAGEIQRGTAEGVLQELHQQITADWEEAAFGVPQRMLWW